MASWLCRVCVRLGEVLELALASRVGLFETSLLGSAGRFFFSSFPAERKGIYAEHLDIPVGRELLAAKCSSFYHQPERSVTTVIERAQVLRTPNKSQRPTLKR